MKNKIYAGYQLTLHNYLEARQPDVRQLKDFVFYEVAIIIYLALILLSIILKTMIF